MDPCVGDGAILLSAVKDLGTRYQLPLASANMAVTLRVGTAEALEEVKVAGQGKFGKLVLGQPLA
ncbi:hypothetical protein CTA1_2689 [Colletotrichum tanaceti]|uniref:Uncharacterized protein n=1 Tax=Colletotrichum tanaceti TaxID=1306861 RepID=A0A4U6X685_9PEZI|nr:hypothetical protein CTA1_2689 [Colletotrichum tanaceti]